MEDKENIVVISLEDYQRFKEMEKELRLNKKESYCGSHKNTHNDFEWSISRKSSDSEFNSNYDYDDKAIKHFQDW